MFLIFKCAFIYHYLLLICCFVWGSASGGGFSVKIVHTITAPHLKRCLHSYPSRTPCDNRTQNSQWRRTNMTIGPIEMIVPSWQDNFYYYFIIFSAKYKV